MLATVTDAKAIISDIINAWDPIDCLSSEARDEYRFEVWQIDAVLKNNPDQAALALAIQVIFIDSFGREFFQKDYQDCLPVARNILRSLAH